MEFRLLLLWYIVLLFYMGLTMGFGSREDQPILASPVMRGIFHWKTSNGLIVALWGAVIAMVALGATLENAPYLFNWGYFFAVSAFIWSLGSWLTSDTLRDKRRTSRRQRRGLEASSRNQWLFWKWGGVIFIGAVFFGFISFVYQVKSTKELQSLKGRLIPACDPTPPNPCGETLDSMILIYGDNGAIVSIFPHTVLRSNSLGPVISLDRSPDGSVSVLMDIHAAEGKVIAKLDKDGFVVNANGILEMHRPDKSSLIVTDEYGVETLNVRYLNAHVIRLNGGFHYPGSKRVTPLQLPFMHYICTKGAAGGTDIGIP